MIIRAKTFRQWFIANLKDRARDIAAYGADAGYHGLIYNTDGEKLFDRFGDEIWNMAYDAAQDQGINVPQLIGSFRRADMTDDLITFKMLMVWFAAEEIARELADEMEDA